MTSRTMTSLMALAPELKLEALALVLVAFTNDQSISLRRSINMTGFGRQTLSIYSYPYPNTKCRSCT